MEILLCYWLTKCCWNHFTKKILKVAYPLNHNNHTVTRRHFRKEQSKMPFWTQVSLTLHCKKCFRRCHKREISILHDIHFLCWSLFLSFDCQFPNNKLAYISNNATWAHLLVIQISNYTSSKCCWKFVNKSPGNIAESTIGKN